jgi:uncharacterized protein (TIGR03435 family)
VAILPLSTAITACALLLASQPMPAQSVATAFEVTSIRQNRSGGGNMGFRVQPGGRFVAENVTLLALIQSTYGFELQEYQIVGASGWMRSDRFDIEARADVSLPPQQIATTLVQSLLADRFALKTHRESRRMPLFALRMARADRSPGPNLRPTAGACAQPTGFPPAPAAPGERRCGVRIDDDERGDLHLDAANVTIAEIASRLQPYVRRVVVDDTALAGRFDASAVFARPVQSSADAAATHSEAASLQRAFEDQLGIKVESREGPLDVLVIDSAQRPEAN